jgi:hypothetical protein
MLTTAVIVFGAGCVLFAAYAILSYQCKQRLAAVRDEVAEQRERKVQKAEGLDVLLARAISEGKHATGQLIEGWQKRRAEILTCTKTGQPWAWDDEDLTKWAREQAAGQTESIKRRTLVTLALTTIALIALAGGSCAVYYSYYASQPQPLPSPGSDPQDLAPAPPAPAHAPTSTNLQTTK